MMVCTHLAFLIASALQRVYLLTYSTFCVDVDDLTWFDYYYNLQETTEVNVVYKKDDGGVGHISPMVGVETVVYP